MLADDVIRIPYHPKMMLGLRPFEIWLGSDLKRSTVNGCKTVIILKVPTVREL